ncbi:ral guanine nucleotide dissociation stimulator-like isoform X3 [Tamandua tetradactyla]|uniref:ral guanine nucleotide dissociation stimulator-like isoform X3 n=1 Tax=Tamandua tetradactyla TaxID=48850 RepID=UPI004053FC43
MSMFSWCFPRFRASGSQRERKETFSSRRRHWLNPATRRSLGRGYRNHGRASALKGTQNDPTCIKNRRAWEQLFKQLEQAVQEGDDVSIHILLCIYRQSHSIRDILDQVSRSYGDICSFGDGNGEVGQECFKNVIFCLLLTWLVDYPDDFDQPPDFPCLRQLVDLAQVVLPGSVLERRAHALFSELQQRSSESSETKTEEPAAVPSLDRVRATSPAIAPAAEQEAVLVPPPVTPVEVQSAPPLMPSEEPSLSAESPDDGLREVKSPVLAFHPRQMAEQLTRMEVELFRKVQAFHCLHAIWSQRAKLGEEHLASTIQATISQFQCVSSSVITTCLGNQRMRASDRARVVEHWIQVAKECQELKNFSSLNAILSALQSNTIERMKQTWEEVSRGSSCLLEEMRQTLNWDLPIQEGTSVDLTGEVKPKRVQKRPLCEWATVPHLWMLLSERICDTPAHQDTQEEHLTTLGAAASYPLPDKECRGRAEAISHISFVHPFLTSQLHEVESELDMASPSSITMWVARSQLLCEGKGRLINYEIALKDYQLILKIQLFQLGWTSIRLRPLEQFGAWFGTVEQLTESERYHLSCEREPPSLSASNTLQAPRLPDVLQPQRTDPQEPIAEPSISGTSLSSDQLECHRSLSTGDTTASIPGHVTCTSQPDLQIRMDPVTAGPGGQEKQQYGEPTSPLCLESSAVTAASSDATSSSAHPAHVAPVRPQRASAPQPLYNQKVGDRCIIRVSLDGDSSTVYKSILVTCDDRAPAVIRKALAKYHLEEEAAQDYELVQMISRHRRLNIPLQANVFYGMDPSGNFNFVLRKRTSQLGTKFRDQPRVSI